MVTVLSRFRKRIFLVIGCIELAVMVLLIVLSLATPRRAQVGSTFALASRTGQRAKYAGELFKDFLERVHNIPLVGPEMVPKPWIKDMDQAIREADQAMDDLAVYEQQTRLLCSTITWIALLLALMAGLHGVYLIVAWRFGEAYSP